ncbi:MAG: hypothetical protein WCD31_06545 [Gillisia sp.]
MKKTLLSLMIAVLFLFSFSGKAQQKETSEKPCNDSYLTYNDPGLQFTGGIKDVNNGSFPKK